MELLRHRPSCALLALSALTAVATHAQIASGQGAPGAKTAGEPGSEPPHPDARSVEPPVLLGYREAVLPDGITLAQPVAVRLEIVVGRDGRVESVTSLSSEVPPELVAAAERAAASFVFQPAKVKGEPQRVAIEYEYWFAASAPIESAEAESEPADVSAPDESTGDGGETVSEADAPVQPDAMGEAGTSSTPIRVDDEVYEAVAEVEAPRVEPTRRSVPEEQLRKVPGARGDAIRAVEVLPGVARAPMGSNPILRGASGHESIVILDGARIPELYHFGGLTSVVHPALLDDVSLYPSNFSARYGRATGGVIEASLRTPRSDGLHGMVDVNLIDSSVLVEGPVADDLVLAGAVRRSNIDFVFENFVPEGTFNVVAAPVYWDYQLIAEYQPNPDGRFTVTAIGSRDALKLVFDQPNQHEPALRGEVSGTIEFQQLTLAYAEDGGTLRSAHQLSVGAEGIEQKLGDWDAYFDRLNLLGRSEWDFELVPEVRLLVGADFEGALATGAYRGPIAPAQEGQLDQSGSSVELLDIDEVGFNQWSPAVFTELRAFVHPRWLVVPGLRLDFYQDLDALTINPRLNQRYAIVDDTTLKAGVGAYSQRPIWHETLDEVGNPELEPYHSVHTSVGVEQAFDGALQLDADFFYKLLYERSVATEGNVPPRFINDGRGRIYGLELGAQYQPGAATYGQLSYTLSRSERQDRDDPWRLFDYDQTHVFNLALSHALGAGWEVGGRFRYVTGNPLTPVAGAVYDAVNDTYLPRYGAQNSRRDPEFHQLDVRVEKQFRIGSGVLVAYLELINAYNAENAEGYEYGYDYSERQRVPGSPFIPNLGVRGEL